jgi:hypothetical protein
VSGEEEEGRNRAEAPIRLGFSPLSLFIWTRGEKNGRSGFAVKKIRRPVNSDLPGGP